MKRIALFTGSFNPFTIGHKSIVDRALPLLDEIVVGRGINPAKEAADSVDKRVANSEKIWRNEPKVKVTAFSGLAVDAARQHGAQFLLRGVRTSQDYEYEKNMANVNRRLAGIETILIPTLPELEHVSSTLARELQRFGKTADFLLPQDNE